MVGVWCFCCCQAHQVLHVGFLLLQYSVLFDWPFRFFRRFSVTCCTSSSVSTHSCNSKLDPFLSHCITEYVTPCFTEDSVYIVSLFQNVHILVSAADKSFYQSHLILTAYLLIGLINVVYPMACAYIRSSWSCTFLNDNDIKSTRNSIMTS